MSPMMLAALAAFFEPSGQGSPPALETQPPEIVVEGPRLEDEEQVLGSRIARPRPDFGNGQIATATGVAGLTPGSGMDPFAGSTRLRTQVECRTDAPLSRATVCEFGEMQAAFESGDFGHVRAGLERLLLRENLTDDERYLAYRVAFALARAQGDSVDRRDALEGMLATRSMPAEQRAPALRTLAAIALGEGDRERAVGLFERAIAAAPQNATARGNLAALYANAGRDEEALELMREAIALARSAGEAVPPHWIAFTDRR